MSKWDQPYQVFDTPCFPARWKVGFFEEDDNATCNYFRDRRDAEVEADKRNSRRATLRCGPLGTKGKSVSSEKTTSAPVEAGFVPRFKVHDRVRIRFGRDRGHYGTVTSSGGDDGTYYGVKLDCHDRELGYSEYELDAA